MLTQERLKEVLFYNPSSGDFVRLVSVSSNTKPGDQAGCLTDIGGVEYLQIRIDGVLYYSHRLAWFYLHGAWPPEGVDHKDGIGFHNWETNLRPAGQSGNLCNQSRTKNTGTGHKNVHWDAQRERYVVWVKRNYKAHFCGRFVELSDAVSARDAALERLHGTFARAA